MHKRRYITTTLLAGALAGMFAAAAPASAAPAASPDTITTAANEINCDPWLVKARNYQALSDKYASQGKRALAEEYRVKANAAMTRYYDCKRIS